MEGLIHNGWVSYLQLCKFGFVSREKVVRFAAPINIIISTNNALDHKNTIMENRCE